MCPRKNSRPAYKVVAKNIVTTPESKDMQELYTKFQAEYPLGDMTTATKMKDVFHELNDAIAIMRLMQNCGNAEYERACTRRSRATSISSPTWRL